MYAYCYRFYEPNLQRWINRDPIGEWGGINIYGFVGNNPMSRIDPWGLAGGLEDDKESDSEGENTGEILARIRLGLRSRYEGGRYMTDAELEARERVFEKGTEEYNEKYEPLPPYFGDEPIMRSAIPKGSCPNPVVIGRNMLDRVIPFAKANGFDYYTPPERFQTDLENLAYNAAQIQEWKEEGRIFIDIGPDPQNPKPSIYYNMESSMVSENSVPVISFSGFK